ncbi:MAG: hypothetical protein LW875_03815 [Proteobacteria bacterium]|nr:hypothetical protein [Pseudomonadota bacterium]
MKSDLLTLIIKRRITKADPDKHTSESVVFDSVAEYMLYLMSLGNVPQQHLDQVETDLKNEALEIYRKITYGSLSLKDYKDRVQTRKVRAS